MLRAVGAAAAAPLAAATPVHTPAPRSLPPAALIAEVAEAVFRRAAVSATNTAGRTAVVLLAPRRVVFLGTGAAGRAPAAVPVAANEAAPTGAPGAPLPLLPVAPRCRAAELAAAHAVAAASALVQGLAAALLRDASASRRVVKSVASVSGIGFTEKAPHTRELRRQGVAVDGGVGRETRRAAHRPLSAGAGRVRSMVHEARARYGCA